MFAFAGPFTGLGAEAKPNLKLEYYHRIEKIQDNCLVIEDGTEFSIGWFYSGYLSDWKEGERLKLYYHQGYSNYLEIENIDNSSVGVVWGIVRRFADEKSELIGDPDKIPGDFNLKMVLDSGAIFKCYNARLFLSVDWYVGDRLLILHTKESSDRYVVWNVDNGTMIPNWAYVDRVENTPLAHHQPIDFTHVLDLEEKLNERVLGQSQAAEAVATSIVNYAAGFRNPKAPIKVFIFLGPSGTGKTEMAKALTTELFGDENALIRLDMSHFKEPHSMARLLGAPPGYVNHEEGGQLTEAIKKRPQSVVLLDEIEKAHPNVQKVFLPVFDEGYIVDAKGDKVLCNEVVFIMTSNLCSETIAQLSKQKYFPDEILEIIIPEIIERLSPELFGRMEPVVFVPLSPEVIEALVNRHLAGLIETLKAERDIDLIVGESAKEYLIKNGYSLSLGARPLKSLVQKKVVGTISKALIGEKIPNGSHVELVYDARSDQWIVKWQGPENL